MNPLTNVRNIQKLNQLELKLGGSGKTSWHNQYKDSAWIFVGGLPYDLTEGDLLAVFSQYGEIVNINLVRDKSTGKSKGFAFMCYEDQRSTILTVDNLNSIKLLGRTLRVDHCENYRRPKETGEEDDLTQQLRAVGCAPKTPSASEDEQEEIDIQPVKKIKKEKDPSKRKKKKVKKEKKRKRDRDVKVESDSDSDDDSRQNRKTKASHFVDAPIQMKKEKVDPGYDKYATHRSVTKQESFPERVKIKREPGDIDSRETTRDRHRDRQSDRDRSRDYDPDRIRDSSHSKAKYQQQDRDTSRGPWASDHEERKDRGTGYDRTREMEGDVDRFRVRDRMNDRDRTRERGDDWERKRNRESDRDRFRERDDDRDRVKERESDSSRTRDRDRQRDSDREKHRR